MDHIGTDVRRRGGQIYILAEGGKVAGRGSAPSRLASPPWKPRIAAQHLTTVPFLSKPGRPLPRYKAVLT
jgi:hypothetical protein